MIEKFKRDTDQTDKEYVKKNIWAKVKKVASKVPFVSDAVSMYFCSIDTNTPLHIRVVAFSALAYFISPIDLIPDTIPGLGYTDDAGVIATAIMTMGPYITEEHRDKAKVWLEGNV